MAQHNTREGKFRTQSGGIFTAALIFAYFAAPLVSVANPTYLAIGGLVLSVGFISVYDRSVLLEHTRFKTACAYVGLIGGILILLITFAFAMVVDGARDKRCAILQKTMLEGRGKVPNTDDGRSPAHDAFAALRCRPQLL